jgi:hypothetical protein
VVADPGQQPGGPGADDQANLGAPYAGLASLLKGGLVALGQPGPSRATARSSCSSMAKAMARSTSRWTREATADC